MRKQCINWGLFSVVDYSTVGALVNMWGSRMVYVGLSQNNITYSNINIQCVCL